MATLRLFFANKGSIKLVRIEFTYGVMRRCSNGRSPESSERGEFSFRWTRGVVALSVLLLRTALSHRDSSCEGTINGEAGSLAAALDRALCREPVWIRGVFGTNTQGAPLSRKIFRRSNPRRRCGGPVTISLNGWFEAGDVRIFLDGSEVSCKALIKQMIEELETFYD
jgi:hypothetical protein